MTGFPAHAFLARTIILLLALAAAACSRAPLQTAQPVESRWPTSEEIEAILQPPADNYRALRTQLQTLLATAPHPERIGACIREVNSPLVVFDHHANGRFAPVASQKLLTTAAALDLLGPEFRYLTRVECAGTLDESVLRGHLILTGSGDPTLGSRFALDPRDPTAVFRRWAADIREFGIEKIDGAVLGNDNYFDDVTLSPDWPRDELGESFLAEVSALSFNENAVDVFWRAGKKRGNATQCELSPRSEYYLFHNGVLTGEEGNPPAVTFRRQIGTNLIQSRGTIPPKSQYQGSGTISNPTAWSAVVFRETLIKEGIEVVRPRAFDMDDWRDPISSQTWPVVIHRSPPLSEIVAVANRFNVNLIAEMLLKTIGKEKRGEGSFQSGCAAVKGFLERNRLDGAGDSVLLDGSGFSRHNSVSPRLIAALLRHMAGHPASRVFEGSLPHPGEPGCLEDFLPFELENEPMPPRRIQAVSGTSTGGCDLAGYVTTEGEARLAFAFVVNDPDLPAEEARALLERMILLCSRAK